AEIGSGFRPCTRSAQLYSFPSEEDCFLRFLDTRGLGDVAYDPTDEMRQLEDQAHLLIVVLKAMDHAQQGVMSALRSILKTHPKWPVIVLQTSLHEGYPTPQSRHVLPYPFSDPPYPSTVPRDLSRSLAAQRQWFVDYRVRFVPVDFTLPEDGYEPERYGLEALWSAVEEALPMGLWAMLKESPEARRPLRNEHYRTARPHVVFYSLAAGGAGAVPLPMVDVPLVLAIQAKLFHTIASIYGQPISVQRMAEISSALGIGFLGRQSVRELAKLVPIPGFGSSVAGLYAAASTFALGSALCEYFGRVLAGDVPDRKILRQLYAEEFRRGERWLREQIERRQHGGEPTQ
ncbi:MAG: DUF697 domain-containing protein, partial [Planctomycetes bacterium]|nr:DUF697 domain-containing protein [Planctomycetota bacterium]